MALFGSRAKNTATEKSDYDFVISRGKIQSLFQLASFIDELETVFGKNVDVITDTSNDIYFLEQIKKDEVVVYEAKRQDDIMENDYADERYCSASLWQFRL